MTSGNRRNMPITDFDAILRSLQCDNTPPSTRNVIDGLLGLSGPLGQAKAVDGGIFGSAGLPKQPAPLNALSEIFGSHPLPTLSQIAPSPSPVRRAVFFSFHYHDIRRSSIVRKSWKFRPGWSEPSDNFKDKSLWEKSRSESDEALRRLIRKGMTGSSVTCVLAGTETWSRHYVRYEIAHSLFKKNGLFTVFIHNVNDPTLGYAIPGYDPLSHMGLEMREDGKGRVCELVDNHWQYFEAMKFPVPWPRWLPKPSVGWLHPLSMGTRVYDWHFDGGPQNLPRWAQVAADAAGKR